MPNKKNAETIPLRGPSEKKKSEPVVQPKADSTDQLLQSCQKMLEENLMLSRKIKRHITMMAVASYIKLFLILLPVILGFIFLPPIFKQVSGQYQELLGIGNSSSQGGLKNVSPDVLSEFIKSLK